MTSDHLEEWDGVCWTTPNINGSFWSLWIFSIVYWGKNLLPLTLCKRKPSLSRGKWVVQQTIILECPKKSEKSVNAFDQHVLCLYTLVIPCVFWSCLDCILPVLGLGFLSVFPYSSILWPVCLFKLICSLKPWTQTLPAVESSLFFCHNVTGNACKFECQRAKFSLWQSSSNVREAVLGTLFHLRELSGVQGAGVLNFFSLLKGVGSWCGGERQL